MARAGDVDPVGLGKVQIQPPLGLGDLGGADPGGEFQHFIQNCAVGKAAGWFVEGVALAVVLQAGGDFVLDDAPAAAQFAQAVEVAQ